MRGAGGTDGGGPSHHLGELLALRKILLNLQFAAPAGEPVTRERLLGWIADADADKTEKASARLPAAE